MREIEIVALFAATLRPCSVCDLTELGRRLQQEQAGEAPAAARRDSDLACATAAAVFARYGSGIRVRLTPIDSPRGVWLALRHRLGGGPHVLVGGRRVALEPENVLAALA